ncbi:hypothetical protein TNCV_4124561 [Trichonephila clavipes]|nr:hypothetical protein TNCV_4124561 [Trichonephila clavipes]
MVRRTAAKFISKLLSVEHKELDTINYESGSLQPLAVFLTVKIPLKESRFPSRDEKRRNATVELNTIPKKSLLEVFSKVEGML